MNTKDTKHYNYLILKKARTGSNQLEQHKQYKSGISRIINTGIHLLPQLQLSFFNYITSHNHLHLPNICSSISISLYFHSFHLKIEL